MGEDDNFMDKKKPHKAKHAGELKFIFISTYFT